MIELLGWAICLPRVKLFNAKQERRYMDYIITETITHYHKFSVEDDVDMERVIALAQRNLTDGGYSAVCEVLNNLNVEYDSCCDFCGSTTESIDGDIM